MFQISAFGNKIKDTKVVDFFLFIFFKERKGGTELLLYSDIT